MTTLVGTSLLRREDATLLTGEARFVDDLDVPGELFAGMVRSPYAHARIRSIDLSGALAMPGVTAAFTGQDLRNEWEGPLPCACAIPDMLLPEHWPVALDKAKFVGDLVAVVVANSREAVRDARDAVVVGYEELPVVADVDEALTDRIVIHDGSGTNTTYTWSLSPDESALEAAFASAAYTVTERLAQPRLVPSAMEPRGVCVVPAPHRGDFTVYSSTQIPHILRVMLAVTVGIPEQKLRVVAPSVGGGFGSKLDVYAEEALCLALARRLRRPVRWAEERSENTVATTQGRGMSFQVELAADEDARVTAVRVTLLADMGAYLQLVTPIVPICGAFTWHGAYDVPHYSFTARAVFTNKTPTDAYRGAGRPESNFGIERAMDSLAREIGLDPAELRRRNFIRPDQFPYHSAPGLTFDSGNYNAALERALELVEYEKLRLEQAQRRAAGSTRHLGIGLSTYVEMCAWAPSRFLAALNFGGGGWETGTVRVLPTGRVEVVTGTTPHGQGFETCCAQVVAEKLGISPEEVDVLHSDTAIAPAGLDTYGSRSLAIGGTAVWGAAEKVLAKARSIAAHQLEVAEEDLDYDQGAFTVKGSPDLGMTLPAVAFEAFSAHNLPDGVEPNLEASTTWDPPNMTFPSGSHVCVVEVDEETGHVEILDYVAVDDCGVQMNPAIVEGQIHGGVAQGVAEALFEGVAYDENGNLLTSTFLDYLMPSAAEFPSFRTDSMVTPSPTNPLGVKGVGEAGAIAATPAVVNAIVDALAHLGIDDVPIPASPERVWRAIQQARR